MCGRHIISSAAAGLALSIVPGCATAEDQGSSRQKPNIIFILADDLAYKDVSCLGQKNFPTPNIDRLAAAGRIFTNAYAGAAWCAPSRTALLTGRNGMHFAPLAKDATGRGTKFNPTVAEMFKSAGYATCAIGKWHMYEGIDSHLFGKTFDANKEKINWQQMPWHRGFDVCHIGYFYGYNPHYPDAIISGDSALRRFPENKNVNQDYLSQIRPSQYDAKGRFVDRMGVDSTHLTYAEEVYREEAVKFIRTQGKSNPFFLYYATPLVHSQLAAKELREFKGKSGWSITHKVYASMVQEVDLSVGAILDEVKRQGIEQNTLIIFTSDNGYAAYTSKPNVDDPLFQNKGPWNRGKFNMTNGGHIVPFIACWPGRVPHGETGRAINFCDFMATAAELAGGKLPGPTEGVSYVPLLEGRDNDQPLRKEMIWPVKFSLLQMRGTDAAGTNGQVPNAVLLDEKWYAVVYNKDVRIFDISTDPGMKINLAPKHEELVARALAEFNQNGHKLHPGELPFRPLQTCNPNQAKP